MMSADRYVSWTEENRERLRDYQRAYYALNKARIRARQNATPRKSGLNNQDYKRMLIAVLEQRDGSACGVCGKPLGGDRSVDHIVPRCMKGTDDASNLRLAHKSCNRERPRGHKKWRGKEIING
jgi:5-methylcytosine-specific restriction endonuclease McrA